MDALLKELGGLRQSNVWDETRVREWRAVASDARRPGGKKVHVGRIFGIVVEKNTQLGDKDKARKYKGRIVFQGNNTRDENSNIALFDDTASSPAAMEAGKAVDAYGLLPGHAVQQADAQQAYIQCELGGDTITWVRLPVEFWPQSWHDAGYIDPVVPLVKALYGHPRAGHCWEEFSHKVLVSKGFEPIRGWRSCFWHKALRLFLAVYVDDFKLSGPSENMAEGWRLISKGTRGVDAIDIDEPTALDKYLGATHRESSATVDGRKVRTMEYDMSGFMQQCVDLYMDCAAARGADPKHRVLKPVPTPFVDIGDEGPDPEQGALQPDAARVLMKILYAARVERYDLLRAVSFLASRITTWTRECDALLHRLISYIDCTKTLCLKGYVGDSADKVRLTLWTDADLAGCRKTRRSPSGVFIALTGPNTWFPLNAISKKQTSVSHSTPEAELVALDHGVRAEGLPALDLWEVILGRSVVLDVKEDNQAALIIATSGKNPNIRHMSRTHGVCCAGLHEILTRNPGTILAEYCTTGGMAADVFTKPFTEAGKWRRALDLVGMGEAGAAPKPLPKEAVRAHRASGAPATFGSRYERCALNGLRDLTHAKHLCNHDTIRSHAQQRQQPQGHRAYDRR